MGVLYLIYTYDLPTTEDVLLFIGAFVNDTALIATNKNAEKASYMLQENLDKVST